MASVITSGVVGSAAVVGSTLGVRWAASLNRHNWMHERKVEAYIEIVASVQRQGEACWAYSRARGFPDIVTAEPLDIPEEESARLKALEDIYASARLVEALSGWRYCMTQVAELLSYSDDTEQDVQETRASLFGDFMTAGDSGLLRLESTARQSVIDVVATELGQRTDGAGRGSRRSARQLANR